MAQGVLAFNHARNLSSGLVRIWLSLCVCVVFVVGLLLVCANMVVPLGCQCHPGLATLGFHPLPRPGGLGFQGPWQVLA